MRRALLGCALIAMTTPTPSVADQLVVNGHARTYVIEKSAAKGPQPTIIMLHGAHGTGADVARATKLGTLAPQQGFVAVFPDGPRPHWNFFLPGKELEFYVKAAKATGGVADDGAFLKSLVGDLVQRGIADPRRIYLAGESSGSVMALRMLCTDADLFAGMALLAPAMPERTGPECHPSRAVPILLIKGTKDEVFPYAGGVIKPEETFLVWPQDRLVNFLQHVDNHKGAPSSSFLPRKVPNTVAVDRWDSCSGTLLTVYRVIDGPHAAPSDLNAGKAILDFFASPMRSDACVASLPGPAANRSQTPGANPGGNAGEPSNDPNSQGATPGTGTGPGGTPGTDPNAPGMTSPGGGPGDTGGLGPPTDPNNPGTDTAALGPPPDEPTSNPTGGLGPPSDPPMNNPPGPGTITTFVPPIFIPIPSGPTNVSQPPPKQPCNPPMSKPGNICHPKPQQPCNPQSASTPANSNPPAAPLKLKPPPTQTAAVPPPQNTGPLHLKPATPVPVIPASVTPTGPANPCVKPKKKKEAEKKHRPKYDNSAANAAATAATAAAIISIVGAVSRRGGGGGGGGGGYRGNPCHHH